MKRENLVREKSFDFALNIIEVYKKARKEHEYVLSNQLVRAATSIGANIEEALAASSRRDFGYRMAIASREARESRYWLRLLKRSKLLSFDISAHLKEVDELILILTSIVKTTLEGSNRETPD